MTFDIRLLFTTWLHPLSNYPQTCFPFSFTQRLAQTSYRMAEKQKQPSQKLGKGLPVAPWIFINNSFDCSTIYSDALCSLIPHSQVYKRFELLTGFGGPKSRPVSIWADSSAEANEAAEMARSCQVEALNHGCNMASISLCNDNTFSVFSALEGRNWPQNHLSINVDRVPVEEVAKRIVRWLCTCTNSSP